MSKVPIRKRDSRPQIRVNEIDDALMRKAERHYAKSAALVAGAAKLLTDFVNNTMWGTDITIIVAIRLLREARQEQKAGHEAHKEAKS